MLAFSLGVFYRIHKYNEFLYVYKNRQISKLKKIKYYYVFFLRLREKILICREKVILVS